MQYGGSYFQHSHKEMISSVQQQSFEAFKHILDFHLIQLSPPPFLFREELRTHSLLGYTKIWAFKHWAYQRFLISSMYSRGMGEGEGVTNYDSVFSIQSYGINMTNTSY